MSKKRKRTYKVEAGTADTKRHINMNEINIKKSYISVDFRTGRHMTRKDRPRKKDWITEAESYI